jgi:hypothetical protein
MGKKMTMTLVSKNIAIFPPKIGRNCRKNDHNIDPPELQLLSVDRDLLFAEGRPREVRHLRVERVEPMQPDLRRGRLQGQGPIL